MNTKKRICMELADIYLMKFYSNKSNIFKLYQSYCNSYDSKLPDDVKFIENFKQEVWPLFVENVILEMKLKASSLSKRARRICEEEIVKVEKMLRESIDIEKSRSKVDIGCPVCRTRLIFIDRGNYESIDEHVSNPNGPVVKKDSYGCPNESCSVHNAGMKWLSDGEGPYYDLTSSVHVDFIDKNNKPFRTGWRSIEGSNPSNHFFTIHGDWSLMISVESKADNNGRKSIFKSVRVKLLNKNVEVRTGFRDLLTSLNHYRTVPDYVRSNMFKNDIKYPSIRKKHWWHSLSFSIAKMLWYKDYQKALTGAVK